MSWQSSVCVMARMVSGVSLDGFLGGWRYIYKMRNPDLLDLAGGSNNSDDDDLEVQYDEQDIDDNNQEATKVQEETPEEKELKKMREKIAKQRQREEDDSDDQEDGPDDYHWKRHFGNNFVFFFGDDNEPYITLGPQCTLLVTHFSPLGQFIICIVFSLISISTALIYLVAMKKGSAIYVSSIIISGL